jgi:hypothetical protein
LLENNGNQHHKVDKEEIGEDQQKITQKSVISNSKNQEANNKPKVTRNKRRHLCN